MKILKRNIINNNMSTFGDLSTYNYNENFNDEEILDPDDQDQDLNIGLKRIEDENYDSDDMNPYPEWYDFCG